MGMGLDADVSRRFNRLVRRGLPSHASTAVAAAFLACRLFFGNVYGSGRVRRMRGARFEITRASSGIIHTDGECHAAGTKIEVAVLPGSLRVVCPPMHRRAQGHSRLAGTASRASFALRI